MAAMPPIPARFAGREAHQAREMAESFGADPQRYDRSRPRYPEAMVQAVVTASPGLEFLDVGCGTGIAARQFQAAGCRVLGVDVDERMAGFARGRELEVEVARFEAWDPAGREFDAVLAGQTWHWVDPVAGAVQAARVLRPRGRLAVFWNADQAPPELAEAFAAVYRRVLADSPVPPRRNATGADAYEALSHRAADGIRAAGGFGEPEQWRFEWERTYTREEWLDQMRTSGVAGQLPGAVLEEVLAEVGDAVDAAGGSFTMPYVTVVLTAARDATAR